MKASIVAAVAGFLALLAPLAAPAQMGGMNAQDITFVRNAAQGGLAEVADARLALRRSRTPDVDRFAQRMIVDHSMANQRLTGILRREGMPVPQGAGRADGALHAKLESLHGAAFDSAYLSSQRRAHQQTVQLFQSEIARGQDNRLVLFAQDTLPIVQSHLAMLAHGM